MGNRNDNRSFQGGHSWRPAVARGLCRQFFRSASTARPSRSAGRIRPVLLLLRRALHAGLPDVDRYPDVHQADRHRQSARIGQDHLRPEYPRRYVRPRLPDRNIVRGSLRARDRRGQAGADRPPAALCHRRGDGRRQAILQAREIDRQEGCRGWRRSRRSCCRAPAGPSRSRGEDSGGSPQGRWPQ